MKRRDFLKGAVVAGLAESLCRGGLTARAETAANFQNDNIAEAQNRNSLFPEIAPYRTGWLKVSKTHHIYFEECGSPTGKPAVVLHGGPGSGSSPISRRYHDPDRYRIILFDQRGCGRS